MKSKSKINKVRFVALPTWIGKNVETLMLCKPGYSEAKLCEQLLEIVRVYMCADPMWENLRPAKLLVVDDEDVATGLSEHWIEPIRVFIQMGALLHTHTQRGSVGAFPPFPLPLLPARQLQPQHPCF